MARTENAGPHTVGASFGKAFASASVAALTSDVTKNLPSNPALADIPGSGYLVLASSAVGLRETPPERRQSGVG